MQFYIAKAIMVAAACFALTATAAQTKAQATKAQASQQPKKLTANDADVEFALTTVASAIKQYNALPEAKKKKLEAKVAMAAGATNVVEFSQTMRTMASVAATKPIATKENREVVRQFLNANQKWCGVVKATRLGQQAMAKMGMKRELSLDDIVNLLPE